MMLSTKVVGFLLGGEVTLSEKIIHCEITFTYRCVCFVNADWIYIIDL